MINNICGSVNDYLKFQESIPAKIRIMTESSYWVAIMYGTKAAIKNMIDDEYMSIPDQSPALKQSMEKTYASLDCLSEGFARSMKDIVNIFQSNMDDPDLYSNAPILTDS